MGKSWDILTSLKDDLQSYLDSNYAGEYPFDIERYPAPLSLLDNRSQISGIRIGLFEDSDDVITTIEDGKAKDGDFTYMAELFLPLGRVDDYDDMAEQHLLEFKDHLQDWSFAMDANSVDTNIFRFGYIGTGRTRREERFTSMDMQFSAFRQYQ